MHHQGVGGRSRDISKPESLGQDDGQINTTFSFIVHLKLPWIIPNPVSKQGGKGGEVSGSIDQVSLAKAETMISAVV